MDVESKSEKDREERFLTRAPIRLSEATKAALYELTQIQGWEDLVRVCEAQQQRRKI